MDTLRGAFQNPLLGLFVLDAARTEGVINPFIILNSVQSIPCKVGLKTYQSEKIASRSVGWNLKIWIEAQEDLLKNLKIEMIKEFSP